MASVYFVPVMCGFFTSFATAGGAIAAMIAGGIAAATVFFINETLDAHFFVSELFAGLAASALAMWLFSARGSVTAAEREVLRCLREE